MAGRRWTPTTDEQRAALGDIEQAADQADAAEARIWELVDKARALGVPTSHAAKMARRGRTTAYRRRHSRAAPD